MREPIEGAYFNWLRAKVVDHDAPGFVYLDLFRILYRTEFFWKLIGDRNRAEDGKELREDFLRETDWKYDEAWFNLPCSVLEMLVALARRASFQTDLPVSHWFWRFIQNLVLDGYRTVEEDDVYMIERILNTWIWRIYDPTGYGGLFPLREPKQDQRRVEIWYQFFEYLEEQGMM